LHHDIGPLFDRATEIAAAAEGIIDDQGNAVLVGDMGQGGKIGNIKSGIADRLDV
jgi:hypothetical protein